MRRMLFAALVAALTMALVAPAAYAAKVKIEVLSSKQNQVSGGDALVAWLRPPNCSQRCR